MGGRWEEGREHGALGWDPVQRPTGKRSQVWESFSNCFLNRGERSMFMIWLDTPWHRIDMKGLLQYQTSTDKTGILWVLFQNRSPRLQVSKIVFIGKARQNVCSFVLCFLAAQREMISSMNCLPIRMHKLSTPLRHEWKMKCESIYNFSILQHFQSHKCDVPKLTLLVFGSEVPPRGIRGTGGQWILLHGCTDQTVGDA